jgi:hypothetical protein
MKKARKAVTFLKKRYQKTFGLRGALESPRPTLSKSFLLLFFKKEALSSFLAGAAA